MGGVDLNDRMISYYPLRVRTKKWTVRTIYHFIDLALTNTWIQYRNDVNAANQEKSPNERVKAMQFLNFRLYIAKSLLAKYDDDFSDEPPPEKRRRLNVDDKRPKPVPPIPDRAFRIRGARHLPEFVDVANAQRCRLEGCKQKTRIQCTECELFLCCRKENNCFYMMHM